MDRDGKKEDISIIPVDAEPQMGILSGGDEGVVIRIPIGTVIEYLKDSEWIEATVVSPNSVSVGEEVVVLNANTQIRLKEETSTQGALIIDELPDIGYDAQDIQDLIRTLYGSGFISNYLFGKIEATGGLEITFTSGIAIVDGTAIGFRNPQRINVEAGLSTVRKDLLVLRRDLVAKRPYLIIKKGEANVSMPIPSLEENVEGIYEIPIAEITVQPNVQSISQSDIRDVRRRLASSDFPIIPPEIRIISEPDGSFNPKLDPTYYFNALYGVKTTWKLMYNTESISLRTEGDLASAGRSSGLQGDAGRNATGRIGSVSYSNGYPTGICALNEFQFGVSVGTYKNFAFANIDISRAYTTANEFRVRNRLERIFRLVAINGVNIEEIL